MGCALSDPFDISTTLNHRALIPIHSCRRWRGCSTSCGIRPTRACRPGLHAAAAARPGSGIRGLRRCFSRTSLDYEHDYDDDYELRLRARIQNPGPRSDDRGRAPNPEPRAPITITITITMTITNYDYEHEPSTINSPLVVSTFGPRPPIHPRLNYTTTADFWCVPAGPGDIIESLSGIGVPGGHASPDQRPGKRNRPK